MLGRTHQLGGACSAIILGSFIFPLPLTISELICFVGLIAGAIFGGLLPDIDHPNATISKKVKWLALIINKSMGHRGWTHTLLAWLLVSTWACIPFLIFNPTHPVWWYLVSGISLGYLSHLLLDIFTDSGIPILRPFVSRRLRLASFRTGRVDPIVQVLLVAATTGWLYYHYLYCREGVRYMTFGNYRDFVLDQLEENLELEIITKEQYENLKDNHLDSLSKQMELFYLNCPDMTLEEELERFHKYMTEKIEE